MSLHRLLVPMSSLRDDNMQAQGETTARGKRGYAVYIGLPKRDCKEPPRTTKKVFCLNASKIVIIVSLYYTTAIYPAATAAKTRKLGQICGSIQRQATGEKENRCLSRVPCKHQKQLLWKHAVQNRGHLVDPKNHLIVPLQRIYITAWLFIHRPV
jgi:hypothetical protein